MAALDMIPQYRLCLTAAEFKAVTLALRCKTKPQDAKTNQELAVALLKQVHAQQEQYLKVIAGSLDQAVEELQEDQ